MGFSRLEYWNGLPMPSPPSENRQNENHSHGYENWTIKKVERWRINSFELWSWRRLLRFPWTAWRSNQSVLKINTEDSLEELMLKLKLQYFGHLMQTVNSLEKSPDPGKDWGQGEKGVTENEMVGWHHWLNGHESEQTQEIAKDREAWCAAARGVTKY